MPEAMSEPSRALLFSGHMIDAPDRPSPRFPAEKEPIAGAAIDAAVEKTGAAEGDLALCGGACGGDLLFAEAALRRGLRLEIHIPFDEETFLAKSVDFAGPDWRERYFAASRHPHSTVRLAPKELGPLPNDTDPYERNNVWMLDTTMGFDNAEVHFICLWNGQGGDGAGGTQHMMEQVKRGSGRVHWLDTRTLW
jgi:hypothetical protein